MNPIDDATLLAYAQNTLSIEQRSALEQLAQTDPAVADNLAAMRASRLPIGPAFAAQIQAPLSAHLQDSINAMISAQPRQLAKARDASRPSSVNQSRRSWLGSWAMAGGAMVATFAVGTLVPTPWRHNGNPAMSVAPTPDATLVNRPWVTAIAQYQALYVRETIDQPTQELNQSQKVLTDANAAHPLATFIPDLSAVGYRFKRVQRLGFSDKPLLQMVYLGNTGNPAALCVLPINGPDQSVSTHRIGSLNVAIWQQQGLAFVFASDMPDAQTLAIAQGLYQQQFPKLI